ncbi:MAG: DNA integrity scanning protein DisA nucleotide-binding domain protein, partial [Longicatena sp.]
TLTLNERENLVDELVKACSDMSKTKTGALISIEQGHSLSDFIKTGTPMNSVVSSELLCSIFQYGTPLHDGAVIIQGVKIACAAAYFPPTTKELPTSYGARHRAAVGISEITDSITIVVSEETGNISIAEGGNLNVISEASLHEFLLNIVCDQQSASSEKSENNLEKEAYKETISSDGKKPGVFAHYFKGKNKRSTQAKEQTENKYTKKKKEVQEPVDKMEIEDLTQKQDKGFDQLFDNIVSEKDKDKDKEKDNEKDSELVHKSNHKKAKPKGKEPKKEKKVKEEEQHENAQTSMSNMASSLFDDVIEPEAIVLHYEKDDETPSHNNSEGSDS